MKNVYEQTEYGWKLVRKCKSIEHATRVADQLARKTGKNYCINN